MKPCNLCGNTEWETLEQMTDIKVVRCSCGLVFVTPAPAERTLQAAYSDDYYRPWGEQHVRVQIWKTRMASIQEACPAQGKLLDVGCGTGDFLDLARTEGWDVSGTEFSKSACALVQQKGISVTQGEVWDASFPSGAFDVVTCWHVLEHVMDPKRVLEECFRVLRPGGWLVLATPNVHDHIFRFAYAMTRGARPPLYEPDEREVHLFFFSTKTLTALVQLANFHVVRLGFDRGAATEWGKRLVDSLAHWWFRSTGLHWGMALELYAKKPERYAGETS